MPYILKGRNVLVTGGSRGIGAETVRKFAAEGSNVAINYLASADASNKLAEQVRSQHGVNAVVIQGDMSKMADCKALVRETIEKLGGIDVVVSNAGNTKFGKFEDIYALSPEDWDYTWHCLVMSNIWLLQEAKPTLDANPDGGAFLIMSSTGGLVNAGSSLAYSVTRAASIALNRCLAQSQGPKIRVNAVAPGLVSTDRAMNFVTDGGDAIQKRSVLKRLTKEEEIADTFVFMAKNSGMTGERIRVDSGTHPGM